jgi:hypothetical protein
MTEKKAGRFTPKRLGVAVVVLLVLAGGIWGALFLFGNGDEETVPFELTQPVMSKSEDPAQTQTQAPKRPKRTEDGGTPAVLVGQPKPAEKEQDSAASGILDSLPARNQPLGVAFLEAVIVPLQSELDRFWGWRPNDLIEFTDNVNNYQLGVLEATRRTSIVLAEKISRTGSSDPYVRELEQAMSLFAIDPNNYMFPAPESKYQEGLDNIRAYRGMLLNRSARFYNRMDNLVPLLLTYESLLGSCTENLLKRDISFFDVDDIFFYSQGVAAMVLSTMEGVGVDFRDTIQGANSLAVYEEIVRSLREVVEMDPWIVLRGGPHSIFANHRANMAGPMSRARFQMSILHGALTGNL